MSPFGEMPPQDRSAEQALLGGILNDRSVLSKLPSVRSEDFYTPEHRRIFAAIERLLESGKPIDAVLVSDRLKSDGDFDRIGGEDYLAQLVASCPFPDFAPDYAEIVVRHAKERDGIHACTQLQVALYEGAPADQIAEQFVEASEHMTERGGAAKTNACVGLDFMFEDMASGEYWKKSRGLRFPVDSLNERLTLRPGELTILGASTSHGKSALCAHTGLHAVLEQGARVLFVSTEMLEREVLARMLCMDSGVKTSILRENALNEDDCRRLEKTYQRIKDANGLHILDLLKCGELSVATISAHAQRLKNTSGLDLVVVDYIQQLHAEGDTRELAVGSISAGLKRLALRCEIPVLAAAQLNREASGAGRPMLHHLRESGRLEQDANNVILLHYPCRDNPQEPSDTIECYVDKVREGEVGKCTLGFNPQCLALFNRGGFRYVSGDDKVAQW